MLNSVAIMGKIPDHDAFKFELKNGGTDKAYIQFMIGNRRPYKAQGEEYAKDDLFCCKGFKGTAQLIYDYFNKGDEIIVMGELRRDNDYTDEAGNRVYGDYYILVTRVEFPGGKKSDSANTSKPAIKAKVASTTKPVLVTNKAKPVIMKPPVSGAAVKPVLNKRRSIITG